MTDWELILAMVGEKATTDITISKDSQGFNECKDSGDPLKSFDLYFP
jgi:hypothetical protein